MLLPVCKVAVAPSNSKGTIVLIRITGETSITFLAVPHSLLLVQQGYPGGYTTQYQDPPKCISAPFKIKKIKLYVYSN